MSLASPEGSGAHQWDADDHLARLWGCGESRCHRSASWHSGSLDPRGSQGHHQSLRYWSAWFYCLFAIHSARAGWGWDGMVKVFGHGGGGGRWWGRRKSKCLWIRRTAAVSSQLCHTWSLKQPRFTDKCWPRELRDLPQTTSSDSHQTTCCLKDLLAGFENWRGITASAH